MVNRALNEAIERAMTDLTLEITAELQEATPIDIGWARANWVPGIGGPGESLDRRALNESEVAQQSAAQQAAVSSVLSYTLNQGSIFITNNVPYIGRLNEGSSVQAPAGFIQQSVETAVRRIAR